ncbi:MAG: T9SS C-terminal target domain-containing protein, partial [Candidatus Neomarinimicrobiota bacterium]
ALRDVNGNGKDDIIFGTDTEHLWVVLDDGTTASGFPFTAGGDFRTAPSVGTVQGVGVVFAGSRDDSFYAVNLDGTVRFAYPTGGDVSTSAALLPRGDSLWVFFGGDDGFVYGLDSDGNNLDGWPIDLGSPVKSSPVLADLDSDGSPEVITGTSNGVIAIFHLDGSPYSNFPYNSNTALKGFPTVADVDGDGDLEVLIGTSANLMMLDIKSEGDLGQYWTTHQGNIRRNGNVDSPLMAAEHEGASLPGDFRLYPNYPNPFNPSTTIAFDLAAAATVEVSIRNLLGQEVDHWKPQTYPPGTHRIVWSANPQIPSGIYFVQWTASHGTQSLSRVEKMLLVK